MEMIKNLRSTVHITEQDVLGMHQEFYGNSLESEKHYISLNKMYFLCIKNSMEIQWTLFTTTPFVPKHFDDKLNLLL